MPYKIVFSALLLIPIVLTSQNVLEDARSGEEDGGSSLVFVFDTTGSMHDDLRQLSEGAEMIMDTALEESNLISDFVFVPFHDPGVGPATVTRDKGAFLAALARVMPRGGGDCPERALAGLLLALAEARPGSFIYVLTDASAGDHQLVGQVLDAVQRKQSQIVFVLTGHCEDLDKPHYRVYQTIARASSGQVFNLNKTSVHNVLDFVRSSLKGRMVNLGSAVNPAGYNYIREIPVDDTLSEVTVSVSGAKPAIRVVDPSGQPVTGPPRLLTTLDLAEIMVVKVVQPEPGNWSITVGSEDEHSVRVAGQSALTFRPGFALQRPGSAAATSHRPLQGTLNYMAISLTGAARPLRVARAEILTLEGRIMFEVPLKAIDAEGKLLLAEPFMPPDDLFYVAISGRDENDQELRRVGATAVQAQLPDPPYLTVPSRLSGRRHGAVTLSCRAESLAPVTVTWAKDGRRQTTAAPQSTVLEYLIEELDEAAAGTYRCVAKNHAGVSTASTEVVVIVDPPQVTLSPTETTAYVGEHVDLSCSVFSEAALLSFQLTGPANQSVTYIPTDAPSEGYYIYNNTVEVTQNDTSIYTCKAANKGGEANSTMHVTVQSLPKVEILGSHTLTADVHTSVKLVCDVEFADAVRWLAPNGSEVKSEHIFGRDLSELLVNVSLSDEGNWTCIGVGRKGFEVGAFVYLTVTMKPEVDIQGASSVTLFYGTDSSVVCNVLAKPTPETLSWSKEDGVIFNTTIENPQLNLYTTALTLTNITEASEGTYVCYAENGNVSSRETVRVDVRKNMTLLKGFTDQSVNLYSQLTLNCKVDSYPKTEINWFHNGTKLLQSENIELLAENTTVLIKKIDFSQLGVFVCEATNGYENMLLNGTITVNDLESPVLSKEPRRIKARRGNSTVVTCRILKGKPEPEITWRFRAESSSELSHLPEGSSVSQDQLELHIDDVKEEHAGMYRCVADNAVGTDVYESLLVVQYPPQLSTEPGRDQSGPLEVREGETVTFSCIATGVPPPLVVWTKDGKPIAFTNNIYPSGRGELVLRAATQHDSGVFACAASSALGATQRHFPLFVFVPPVIAAPDIGPALDVSEGQLLSLPCAARGAPPPALLWRHGGAPLAAGGRMHIDDDFVLRFVANLTDFGEYTCEATNQYGNASYTFSVHIWVPPYIEPPWPVEVDTVVGADVRLSCDAVGFPVPAIGWEFEQQPLTENTTDLSFNEVGELSVRNASAGRAGRYACVARNLAGDARRDILLRVNEPPSILPDGFPGPYVASTRDASLTLPCAAAGSPAPFVAWARGGLYIDRDERYGMGTDGSLTIRAPAEELSGQYVCEARNRAGAARATRDVQIYSLPTLMQADQPEAAATALEGTDYTLECPVRVTREHTLKWYKDGKLLQSNLLPNVSRTDAAVYACSVSNAVGGAHAAVALAVQWPPRLQHRDPVTAVELMVGEDHAFDCAADARPKAQTKWLFNSRPIGGEDGDVLRLTDVQMHKIGVYKCIVSNKHGTVVRQYTLDVLVPPFISQFDLLEVQLREGDNATLPCAAVGSPAPNVAWAYNNTNWVQESSSLRVFNASPAAQGVFRCEARSRAGTARLAYRLAVAVPARVAGVTLYDGREGTAVEGTVELMINSTGRIACRATGDPAPRIRWLKNGNTLGENEPGIAYADLVLDPVQSVRPNWYTCVASNEASSDERRVQVKVLEPPQISTSMFEGPTANKTESLEVLSGQAFHLQCHAYGDPPPQVLWYRDGAPLTLAEGDVEITITEFGEELVVNKAAYTLAGNYTCVARNKVGESSFSYLVDVLVSPAAPPADVPSAVRVRGGAPLRLRCPTLGSGGPALGLSGPARHKPRVRWLKQPFLELDETRPRVQLSEDNVTLTINATEISDSGQYTCTTTNRVGAADFTYSVSVEVAPSGGQAAAEAVTVTALNGSAVLYCHADGHPAPTISWFKDGRPLQLSGNVQTALAGRVLAVWRAAAADAGHYRCRAANRAGAGSRRTLLRLAVPGAWSGWSAWSLCSAACGAGQQARRRECRYRAGAVTVRAAGRDQARWVLDASECRGAAEARRPCRMPPCEEAAQWSAWSRWSPCAARCAPPAPPAPPAQTRTRRCRGKGLCKGDNVQIRQCPDLRPCDSTEVAENDVLNNSREELIEPNVNTPEATFELEPEVGPNYSERSPNYPEGDPSNPEGGPSNPEGGLSDPEGAPSDPEGGPSDPEGGLSDPEGDESEREAEELDVQDGSTPSKVFDVVLTKNLNAADDGPCGVGYRFNSDIDACEDIDECLAESNHCHASQGCANTPGGYRCACPRGFAALGAGQRCLDIDECSRGTDGCEYACVNVAGGFVCACPRALRLHADRRRCRDASSTGKQPGTEATQDYLSAKVEFPARFMKQKRN